MPVVTVTDSAARLPRNLLQSLGIRVVPLHVLLDGRDLRDGVDELPADLYQREAGTAGAAPAELAAAYEVALADSAGDGVVAVHLSAELSSTFGSAEHAARAFGGRVVVVDSRSAAMGSGFVALAAARRRLTGLIWTTSSRRHFRRWNGYMPSSSCSGWRICGAVAA